MGDCWRTHLRLGDVGLDVGLHGHGIAVVTLGEVALGRLDPFVGDRVLVKARVRVRVGVRLRVRVSSRSRRQVAARDAVGFGGQA